MKNFKFLLSTDYSDAVMNAERYAVQLAKSTNSTLTFLHVYDLPFISPLTETDYTEALIKHENLELKKLEEHASKVFASLNIAPHEVYSEYIVRDGNAKKEIIKEAKNMGADFIIVGTHGAGDFQETIFGTTTWKVIKDASIPVLSIPQDALFTGVKNLVFTTEYREGEIPVINYLAHISKNNEAALTILHVLNPDAPKDIEKEKVKQFWEEIKKKVDYNKLHLRIIKSESLIETITNYCTQKEVDWLIMSPEKQIVFKQIFGLEQSKIKKVAFQTHIPLLTIPDFYNPKYAKFWDLIEVNQYMSEEF